LGRPIKVWITSLILFLYGIYSCYEGFLTGIVSYAASGVIFLGVAIALFMKIRGSQYLVYILSVYLIGSWLFGLWIIYTSGWPYEDALGTVISLIPGIVIVLMFIFCSYSAHQFLGKQNEKA